jgi:Flp pilus assembly pilin Flp
MKRTFKKLQCLARNEKGGTLAELAIIMPFLAVMLAAVCEVGNYFQTYTTLAKATRAGARYLSNHQYNPTERDRAKSLVVCGKLNCTDSAPLVDGLELDNICIQTTLTPAGTVETVTVGIPRAASVTCDANETATNLPYEPVFDIGALIGDPEFSMAFPMPPSTTMRYIPAD